MFWLPGIKQCAIQKCAIVMVSQKVSCLASPLTRFRHELVLNSNAILGVMQIQQNHIKDKGSLARDLLTYKSVRAENW